MGSVDAFSRPCCGHTAWLWTANTGNESLYLRAVPLSTQLANAISNDGDALFPAMLLLQDRLAATFYSAIPALIVGYLYLCLVAIHQITSVE